MAKPRLAASQEPRNTKPATRAGHMPGPKHRERSFLSKMILPKARPLVKLKSTDFGDGGALPACVRVPATGPTDPKDDACSHWSCGRPLRLRRVRSCPTYRRPYGRDLLPER